MISGSHLSGSRLSGSRANCRNCTPKELRRFGFRSWVVLRGTTPHDLAKDGDDKKVMGFAGASPMAIQCSNVFNMSKCSIVHYLFACSADTGIYRNWLVGPRVFKCKSSWSAIKFYRNASKVDSHCVRVAHRTDLRLAESS